MKLVERLVVNSLLLAAVGVGCGNSDANGGSQTEKLGQIGLPLVTHGASGTKYQLRNAVFEITSPYYYTTSGVGGAMSATGGNASVDNAATGGAAVPVANTIIVNGDDYPDSDSIQVDIAEGSYTVALHPGWQLQSVIDGVAQDVTATLLTPDVQWVYVSRRSTSWVSFQFGLGDSEIWLNGNLNIQIDVVEDPNQLGTGGAMWATGGSSPIAETGGAFNMATGGAQGAN
jgi:hypothetical protein